MPGRVKKRAIRVLIGIAAVIVLLLSAAIWFVSDYYRADGVALAVIADEDGAEDGVIIQKLNEKAIAFVPSDPTSGMVFYPGGKVQAEAYAPLLERCAERGMLCILIKAPFNIPLLDTEAAAGLQDQFPSIERWLIAGHSMGGVAASDYASRHPDDFQGMVFLASYASSDNSSFKGDVLSIVGTEDGVLNRDNYATAKTKLPDTAEELEIKGGNHAGFGNYGDQAGDGVAMISHEEQQDEAAVAISALA